MSYFEVTDPPKDWPRKIHHFREIQDLVINEETGATVRNLAELWPWLDSPSLHEISEDTIGKLLQLDRKEFFESSIRPIGLIKSHVTVSISESRRFFESSYDDPFIPEAVKSQLHEERVYHCWPYIQGDKRIVFYIDSHCTHSSLVSRNEVAVMLKKLSRVYGRHQPEILFFYLEDESDFLWDTHDYHDFFHRLLFDPLKFYRSKDTSHPFSTMDLCLNLLTGRIREYRPSSSWMEEFKFQMLGLNTRLVQMHPLNKNNLALLQSIAEDLQSHENTRRHGRSLARTVVVLTHWVRGRYDNFISS